MNDKTIVIADDDLDVLNYLETALVCEGYEVMSAQDGVEALNLVGEHNGSVAAVVLDLMIPRKNGIETLREVKKLNADLPVFVLSGTSEPALIVEAIKAGATDCLTKPIIHQDLLRMVTKSTENGHKAKAELRGAEQGGTGFLYLHRHMKAIKESLKRLGPWNVPVVLLGESGVGKEVVARELHRLSPRVQKPLIKINCCALPSELLESELFGYEKGAFTGAFRTKPGKFELADGGTILLDEIGDMDLKLQAKLLQVLQDGEFQRLGGRNSVRVDVRVLVATHHNLQKAVKEGYLREDLYYRLDVVSISIPPLRERKEEIIPLAQHFLQKHKQPDAEVPELPLGLRHALVAHHWPGNIRELENVIRRYLVFRDPQMLISELNARSARNRRIGEAAATGEGVSRGSVRTAEEGGPARVWEGSQNSIREHGAQRSPRAEGEIGSASPGEDATGEPGVNLEHLSTDLQGEAHSKREPAFAAASAAFPTSASGTSVPERKVNGEAASLAATPVAESSNGLDWPSRLEQMERMVQAVLASVQSQGAAPGNGSAESSQGAGRPYPNGNGDAGSDPHAELQPQEVATLEQLDGASKRAERRVILAALEQTNWNRKKAAVALNVDYKGLLYRMKKLGIGNTSENATAV
jgi:two-component system response regulator AtoC